MRTPWSEYYRSLVCTAEEALKAVRSGDRVYIHPGCANPEPLVEALSARASTLRDVEVVHLLTIGKAQHTAPEMEGHFRHNAVFIGANARKAVNDGRADYTPDLPGRDRPALQRRLAAHRRRADPGLAAGRPRLLLARRRAWTTRSTRRATRGTSSPRSTSGCRACTGTPSCTCASSTRWWRRRGR